jgi:iron complex transport system ATP-binding protein
MIEVTNMTVRYGSLTIVDNVSFSVQDGEWLMIVGPNGAGKSTIINAIAQCAPYTGVVRFNGVNIAKLKSAQRARDIGILAQSHHVGYAFSVEEVVRLGRYAYANGPFGKKANGSDDALVDAALELTGMTALRRQSVLTLSGGELQRAFLAQLFAQDPRVLILDEPTNHLDLVYQKQTFALIRDWLKTNGRTVLSVVHDLSLARAYGTHALLLKGGKTVSSGEAKNVLTRSTLEHVYAMDVYEWMQQLLSLWQEA